jgi:predicted helicase
MPRREVMQHMLRRNVGLITVRQVAEGGFNHCLVADAIVDGRITTSNKGMGYLFPLYLYPGADPAKGKKDLPGEAIRGQANINPRIKNKVEFNPFPTPEQVFYYVYGILHSNLYREAYAEELAIDFPRIPFTPDCGLFFDMAQIGERLTALHLLKSPELNHCFSNFAGNGSGKVMDVSYDPSKNRIYINNSQYFSGITPDLWDYRMCGYPVMAKWLKSRKGGYLHPGEIDHYRKIARIIQLTIHYQEQINRLYPEIEKSLIKN